MTLVPPALTAALESLRTRIESAKGEEGNLATNTAVVRVVDNQHSEASVRGFTVTQDEPESILGGNRGPTPTDYFVASVGFCENVLFVRNAALAGLPVDALETTVKGSWDRRGLFRIDGLTPRFVSITVETRVTTTAPVEKVADVARLTHATCPVHATLARATELVFRLKVNGQDVPL